MDMQLVFFERRQFLLPLVLLVSGHLLASEPLQNPYFSSANTDASPWKLWFDDPSPIDGATVPPSEDRAYPVLWAPEEPLFVQMAYNQSVPPPAFYPERWSGFWQMCYMSGDDYHSNITGSWAGRDGNQVRSVSKGIVNVSGGIGLVRQFGANLYSQSTSGMQSNLVNRRRDGGGFSDDPYGYQNVEKDWHFANCVLAAPLIGAYRETDPEKTRYGTGETSMPMALGPAMMHSNGRSSSETSILTKMAIASAYLQPDLKERLMRHGHLPSVLLYLWKAALPWAVPYADEIRHRVAYQENGEFWSDEFTTVNPDYHWYDDTEHLRRMVRLAGSMTRTPAIPILRLTQTSGLTTSTYELQTAVLHTQYDEAVTIDVSLDQTLCLDRTLDQLEFYAETLYGIPGTTITRLGHTEFRIAIPAPPVGMPQGRTTILFYANNGENNSNPATLNIWRDGPENRRPILTGIPDHLTVTPGEFVSIDLSQCHDPEGYPLRFRELNGAIGGITGASWSWQVPPDQEPGEFVLAFVASDGCGSESYQSQRCRVTVADLAARITANESIGTGMLSVELSAAGSRDRAGNPLTYHWDFGDGAVANERDVTHTYTAPGVYRISLTISSPLGSATAHHEVHLRPEHLEVLLINGFDADGPDPGIWQSTNVAITTAARDDGLFIENPDWEVTDQEGLLTLASYDEELPFSVEADFDPGGTPGCGIRICGETIGVIRHGYDPNDPTNAAFEYRRLGVGRSLGDDVNLDWDIEPMNWFPLGGMYQLRAYISADPVHDGKFRITGVLREPAGREHFFIRDNLDDLGDGKVGLMTGPRIHRWWDSQLLVSRLVIGRPADSSTSDGIVRFDAPAFQASEVDGECFLTVTRENGSQDEAIVAYLVEEGTAGESTDFLPTHGYLHFTPGETQKSIRIALVNDDSHETTESFTVRLLQNTGVALGQPAEATMQILDDDSPVQIRLYGTRTVEEGESHSILLNLDRPHAFPLRVTLTPPAADMFNDYHFPRRSVLVLPGDTAESIEPFVILDDAIAEPEEVLRLELESAIDSMGVSHQADPALDEVVYTIRPSDGGPGNHSPVIVKSARSNPPTLVYPGTAELVVKATDPDGDELIYTWQMRSGPGTVTFSENNNATANRVTATFSTADQYWAYSLEVKIHDGEREVSQRFSLLVLPEGTVIPTVRIASPADGAIYHSPADVVFTVEATFPGGEINYVILGDSHDSEAPFELIETALPSGRHGFQAFARAQGSSVGAYSEPVEIVVLPEKTTYDDWRHRLDWAGGDDTATGDPDGDGMSNLLEYALVTDPQAGQSAPVTGGLLTNAEGEWLTLEYPMNPRATDLQFELQHSANLHQWDMVPLDGVNAWLEFDPLASDGAVHRMRAVTKREGETGFLRLRLDAVP